MPGLEDAVAFSATYSIQLDDNFYYVKDTPDFNKQRDIHLEVSDGNIIPAWVYTHAKPRGKYIISTISPEVYDGKYSTTLLNVRSQ